MPKTKAEKTVAINFRIPVSLIDEIEVKRLLFVGQHGIEVSKSEYLRFLLATAIKE